MARGGSPETHEFRHYPALGDSISDGSPTPAPLTKVAAARLFSQQLGSPSKASPRIAALDPFCDMSQDNASVRTWSASSSSRAGPGDTSRSALPRPKHLQRSSRAGGFAHDYLSVCPTLNYNVTPKRHGMTAESCRTSPSSVGHRRNPRWVRASGKREGKSESGEVGRWGEEEWGGLELN